MGKPSRDKGKRGENEVVDLFHTVGCKVAKRTAALQAGARHFRPDQLTEADVWIGDGFHVEVKRQEVLRLPAWLRQLERDCPDKADGILFYRRSRERWRAVVKGELISQLQYELKTTIPVVEARSSAVGETARVEVDGLELAGRLVEAGWV